MQETAPDSYPKVYASPQGNWCVFIEKKQERYVVYRIRGSSDLTAKDLKPGSCAWQGDYAAYSQAKMLAKYVFRCEKQVQEVVARATKNGEVIEWTLAPGSGMWGYVGKQRTFEVYPEGLGLPGFWTLYFSPPGQDLIVARGVDLLQLSATAESWLVGEQVKWFSQQHPLLYLATKITR